MKRIILYTIGLILVIAAEAFGQNNVLIVIDVAGHSSNGSTCAPLSNYMSATLKNSAGTVLKSGSVTKSSQFGSEACIVVYEAVLSSGWTGTVSASGSLSSTSCGSIGSNSISDQTITYN